MRFRVQLQCSAVNGSACLDTEIRFPGQAPTTFSLGFQHPAIESFYFNAGTNEWVIDFQDEIFTGTSIEFDLVATVPNHTTPDGTSFIIDATVDSSNTDPSSASATGAWSAAANLGVEKYLQFGPDTDALLDMPVRYYLYPCDPTFVSGALGHLYLENWTLTDQLPTGTVYNNSSGTYDADSHSVTWSDTNYLQNEDCAFTGPTDYWVEVTFPSTVFGEDAVPPVLEATNTAIFEGYPLGAAVVPANQLSDTDNLLHGFGLPNPVGTHTKYAHTPYAGTQDITFENDKAYFQVYILSSSAGSTPYFFRITDPLPCLDYTPNASTQYESKALNTGHCEHPAYQPTDFIHLILYTAYTNINNADDFAADNPTIPLDYVDTNGNSGTFNVQNEQPYPNASFVSYKLYWSEIEAILGAGVGISDLIWDSQDIGVQAIVTSQNGRSVAQMRMEGNVAADTPEYPMLNQYRVRNYGHFNIITGDNDNYIGAIQDDVIIRREAPFLYTSKWVTESSGLVGLQASSQGGSFRPGESLVVTDLLPLGYTFKSESQQYMTLNTGNWSWDLQNGDRNYTNRDELDFLSVKNYIDVEVIDDYNGTGRQLVRATFREPPTTEGWKDLKQFRFSYRVNEIPMNYSAVNTVQIFPTDPVSAAELQCQTTFSSFPSAAQSSDPNDLDNDGITNGDAYCFDNETIIPASTFVDIQSYKAVKGDFPAGADFERFPAIGGISSAGGTVDFQLNVRNAGGVSLQNFVLYDVLPHVGDLGLSETQIGNPRGSDFQATFAGFNTSTIPSGAVIEYSTSNTPCRDELTTGATPFPTGCTDDWTTTIPSPISNVRAFRITFPTGNLSQFDPGEGMAIEYAVTYPAGTNKGEVAWNNFAYAGTRSDDNTNILPTEPPKVGIGIPEIDLSLTKSVSPSYVLVNTPVKYTIVIDHDGSVTPDGVYTLPSSTARNVTLQDNGVAQGLIIVNNSSSIKNLITEAEEGATFDESTGTIFIPTIGPNDTYELTYFAYSPVEGLINNTVEIMSHPNVDDIDSTPGNGVSGEDDIANASANWVAPSIDIQKLVETSAGSGIFIEADASDGLEGEYAPGEPVTYQFVITNTGSTYLSNVTLSDDLVGFACDQNTGYYPAGVSKTITCTWPYGFSSSNDPYVNRATATGSSYINGEYVYVSDIDSAQIIICTNPELTDLADETVCAGENIPSASVTTSVSNGIGVTYQWYNDFGTANPTVTPINGQTTATLTALPTTAGSYRYRVEASNSSSPMCQSSKTVTLVLLPAPEVTVSKSDEHCDQGDAYILFTFNDNPDQTQISFSIDNGASFPYTTQDINTNYAINGLAPGTYDLRARWGDGSCPVTLPSVTIDNVAGPSVNTSSDDVVCGGDGVVISATASGGTSPYLYTWDNGLGNGAEKTVYPTETTTYSVTATDNFGCTATDEVTVTILPATNPICSDCLNPADADNDGVCASEDCDDNDPSLPLPEGTACDDGDAFTDNDVIQSDGCTCQGESIPCSTTLTLDIQQPVYNDNGTTADLSDDTFTFSIQINGNGANGWSANGQSGNYGQTANFGPFSVDAAGVIFEVLDQDNPNCRELVSVNIASCIYSGVCTCCE